MNPIAIAGGTALAMMGVALWFVGNWWLDERDRANRAEFTIELNEQATKHKEDKEKALAELRSKYNEKITELETSSQETISGLTQQLVTAQQDAQQAPIEFGDNVLRDFIYVDCLWSSGKASTSLQGQSTCRDEAKAADPSRAGFSFSVLTPELIRRWGEACREYDTFGGGDEWQADNPGITVEMCRETLVAFTPEFSAYLRIFLQNGASYTVDLVNHALEQDKIIDTLTSKAN